MKRFLRTTKRWLMSPWLLALTVAGLGIVSYAYVTERAEQQSLARIGRGAEETLRVQSDSILRQLEKQRYLPKLLSRHPVVTSFMESNQAFGHDRIYAVLTEAAGFSGAIDIGIAGPDGTLLASANDYLETKIIAGNELQTAALQGRLGRASISDATGRRGYAFSSPIRAGHRIIGIIVAVSPFEDIERSWALSSNPIFAVNQAGQMVAGNLLARSEDSGVREIMLERTRNGGELDNASVFGNRIVFHREIPHLNLTLHTLVPRDPALIARKSAGMISLLLAALIGGSLIFLQSRIRSRAQQHRRERANALRLERMVRDRTRDLTFANRKLETEIAERRTAEERLVRTQAELVQAEKLAAIGQMSAALAHEYNQPLAAIRGYSDNASRFLERGDHDKVDQNLSRIGSLVDRLAALSKTLLAFARKPEKASGRASLDRAVRDAIQIMEMKAEKEAIRIEWQGSERKIMVYGDELRLSQVFVNLISNAIDACRDAGGGSIDLSFVTSGDTVTVFVRDTGAGIDEAVAERVFDPFFTTKEVGEGLGLGLSIAYNTVRDFGGRMTLGKGPGKGAEIAVELKLCKPERSGEKPMREKVKAREPAE